MFTGIIEAAGKILSIEKEGSNLNFWIESTLSKELKIDQSVAHNGVCLTVVALGENSHKVTAVQETILKTNLGLLSPGSIINLERCMLANGRFDGHIVQGHVDDTAMCTQIIDQQGSWLFYFKLNQKQQQNLVVSKGSICINGVSLTVIDTTEDGFYVTIIPYTFEHTQFGSLKTGDSVNIEFDILGKYILKQLESRA
ncbi:MAG: riboflavin synthase [Bacteroidota bacterium]|nr:riboflavin synthase [Bacteroidota bacterium]